VESGALRGLFAAAALFWHSVFTDPDLKNSPVDWLDGGKLFIEGCLIAIVVASVVRWRYAIRKSRQVNHQVNHQVNREIKSSDQTARSSSQIR
jgi:hypothetical protein